MIYKFQFDDVTFDPSIVIGKMLYTNSSVEPLDENLCGMVIGIESGLNGDSLIFRVNTDLQAFALELIENKAPIKTIRECGFIRHFAFSLEY